MTATTTPPGWEDILDEGETILWQGQPRPGIVTRGWSFADTAMGIFFMVFSTVWIGMALNITSGFRNPPFFIGIFPLFGGIFFCIGFWNAIGHRFWKSYMLTRTYYTVTSKRAFIATNPPFGGRSLKDYPIGKDSELELIDGDPGSVQFALQTRTASFRRSKASFGGARRTYTSKVPVLFHRIDDARKVYRHLRDVQQDARRR
ncbi:hypothetical protein [Roseisalinus antarcticus]|uniref:Aspartate carbamoyltransferase catalytic subunit n=1 Tax=Roseisalinus antarcticus TaxID=254357 RepID=A0A1Y5RNM2_9RHOB|nr:hypothetical protein [Roseisalinus antarcticus]SLN21669.1 hypothetical protein ROA7023_00580 [Roseisalinus antarcticus]